MFRSRASRSSVSLLRLLVALGSLSWLVGCGPLVRVEPWQRGVLARTDMTLDSEGVDLDLDDHMYFSREATAGGRSFGGGGCGCN